MPEIRNFTMNFSCDMTSTMPKSVCAEMHLGALAEAGIVVVGAEVDRA